MVHLVIHARLAGSLVKVHCRAMNVTRISILFLRQSTVTLLVLLVVTSILAKHAHIVRQGRPFQLQILKWNVRFVQRVGTILLLVLRNAPIAKETATVWKAPSPAICATRTTITITTPLLPPRISVFAVPLRAPHVPLTVRKRFALFRIVVVWHPRHTNLSFFLFVFLRRLHARDALSEKKLLACHKDWPRDLRVPD